MTSLFALIFMGMMNTAEARPHHQARPPRAHSSQHQQHIHHAKPAHVKVYRYKGHRHYRHAGIVWRWTRAHWVYGQWIRGHWEISYRI